MSEGETTTRECDQDLLVSSAKQQRRLVARAGGFKGNSIVRDAKWIPGLNNK
jgi:hypothetical protein